MRIPIQAATITRTYPTGPVTRRVTLNGRRDGDGIRAYRVGETIEPGHVWEGWTIAAIVDCGTICRERRLFDS